MQNSKCKPMQTVLAETAPLVISAALFGLHFES
jgi:hypothetical protein